MVAIDVDFEVFKVLTARRKSERMTENDVIREALGLHEPRRGGNDELSLRAESSWIVKGVEFPQGSEFRANYKGRLYTGAVDNGALVIGGRRFTSPSAAAVSITGNPVNGWVFWEVRLPGSFGWKPAVTFRKIGRA